MNRQDAYMAAFKGNRTDDYLRDLALHYALDHHKTTGIINDSLVVSTAEKFLDFLSGKAES